MNGWDLVVEMTAGNPYPQTTVRIKPKQTPLSDNNDQVDTWLKNQPNPTEVHREYDYEFIKKQLQNYLSPGSVEDDAPAALPGVSQEAPAAPKSDFTLETATGGAKDRVAEFNDLFNE